MILSKQAYVHYIGALTSCGLDHGAWCTKHTHPTQRQKKSYGKLKNNQKKEKDDDISTIYWEMISEYHTSLKASAHFTHRFEMFDTYTNSGNL